MKDTSKEFVESKVFQKYDKLYKDLVSLIAALNVMEPGGTLLDDIVFTVQEGKKVRVAYVATPIQLTINTPERKFILRVIENAQGDMPIDVMRSRIEQHAKELSRE